MPQTQKLGIVCLFGVGVVLIVVATLRVAQIGGKAQSSSQPSASWLALWGIIECSIAVIVGCYPAFVTLIRNHTTPSVSYNTQGFVRQRNGEQGSGDGGPDAIKLNSIVKSESKGGSSADSKEVTRVGQSGSPFELVPAPHRCDVMRESEIHRWVNREFVAGEAQGRVVLSFLLIFSGVCWVDDTFDSYLGIHVLHTQVPL
jgi:hypothetical protein